MARSDGSMAADLAEAVARRVSSLLPPPPPTRPRPPEDWLPGFRTFEGRPGERVEPFLREFFAACLLKEIPRELQAAQLVGKLRGEAHEWYLLRQRPMTIEELVFGLRSQFGEGYPEASLVAAPFHLAPDPARHCQGRPRRHGAYRRSLRYGR